MDVGPHWWPLRLLLFPVLFGLALAGEAQQPRPEAGGSTFPSAVGLVRVDVVVTDKPGRPVSDLSAADFALSEDGGPQTINSFASVSVAEAPDDETSPERPFASTNLGPEPRRVRTFVVGFDDIHLTPHQALPAKRAVTGSL